MFIVYPGVLPLRKHIARRGRLSSGRSGGSGRLVTAGGFTLPELLLVTGLLVWLSLQAAPGLQQLWFQQQARQQAELVLQHVQQARQQAMGQLHDVYLGAVDNCLWQAAAPQSQCTAATQRWLQEPWQLRAEFGPQPYVRFSAGRAMAGFSSGRFVLWHPHWPAEQVHLVVSSLGRVRWCHQGTELSGVPPCA